MELREKPVHPLPLGPEGQFQVDPVLQSTPSLAGSTTAGLNFAGVGNGDYRFAPKLRNLSRWGDYSAMSIDPVDDCTFFYTNEYLKANGAFNWSTRIASFKFPGCL